MGGRRSEKYNNPLSPSQKKASRSEEQKPEGEKEHLKIISHSHQQLVDILSDANATAFYKSMAKQEILRRLENGERCIDCQRLFTLEILRTLDNSEKPINKNRTKKKKHLQKIPPSKPSVHIGDSYKEGLDNSCPFD